MALWTSNILWVILTLKLTFLCFSYLELIFIKSWVLGWCHKACLKEKKSDVWFGFFGGFVFGFVGGFFVLCCCCTYSEIFCLWKILGKSFLVYSLKQHPVKMCSVCFLSVYAVGVLISAKLAVAFPLPDRPCIRMISFCAGVLENSWISPVKETLQALWAACSSA